MSLKTRLFSLIIVGLLLLPIFIGPQRNGQVLGTREDTQVSQTPATEKNTDKGTNIDLPTETVDSLRQVKVGEIASGIRDVRDTQEVAPQVLKGKAIWDANARSSVVTDKFSLGTGIKVKRGGKTLDLVVGGTRVLAVDTILVLDKKSFIELGGDPEKDNQIEVEVTLDQ
jgi:hypothetical protein